MALPIPQELTEYITFSTPKGAVDASSGKAASSTAFANAWARIAEGGGSIAPNDQQHEIQTQSFEIIIAHIDGITGFMEISWGSRSLVITEAPQKIYDRNRRAWLIIHAEETTERDVTE